MSSTALLLLTAGVVTGVIVLIARFKCSAFVALLLASLAVGIGSGMPLVSGGGKLGIVESLEAGVGRTLSSLALIIGLGTILGKLLAESGAAQVIADRLVRWLGEKRLDYAVMLIAFLVGISVFFGVGVVLIGPIAVVLATHAKIPVLRLALPLAAGLSTAHGLIPPHPGPMAAIAAVDANVGVTIFWSLIVGLPTALVTGPILTRWVLPASVVNAEMSGGVASVECHAKRMPGFSVSVFTLLLPVLLMLAATGLEISGMDRAHPIRQWAAVIGAPSISLLVAVLVAYWTFGVRCGFNGSQFLKFSEQCLGPAASILLVVGAGGGFSAVLGASGVARVFGEWAASIPVSPLLLGWLIAGLLRVAVGSATVAIMMTAGLIGPLLALRPDTNRELLVLAMGAGSLLLSHVNDSGFWFVKEYFGMTVPQTLKTWTIVETGIGVVAMFLILAIDFLL